MKCKHCQREIEDSATVCPYCKTPVIRITPKKVCGYCYTELKKGDKVCKGCGRKIPEELLKFWAEEDLKNALRDGQQSSSKDCYTEKGKLSSKQEGQRDSKTGTEESLQHKQNPSEKREILLFSKKGREEKPSAPDQEFLCLMLSICPPLAAVIFRLLFSSTGFLPWQITILFVYCLSSMVLAYFLEGSIAKRWKEVKGKALGEGYRSLFYLCPPATIYFLLKENEKNQFSFFLVLHFALLLLCFLPFY